MTIFGVLMDELELQHVAAFLSEAGDESLLWEAKGGGARPNAGSVRKAVCGFANSRGGYLIIGADREASAWSVAGVDFGVDEPGTWLDQVIRDGTSPVPPHQVRVLDVDDRQKLAVVEVDPVAEPPCITNDGVVYQRVSGRTVPVNEPLVLARLTEQGGRARERAAADADAALEQRLHPDETFVYQPCTFIFAIALAAVAYEPGVERRLYREETKQHLGTIFRQRLRPDRYTQFQGGPHYFVRVDGVLAQMGRDTFDNRWTVAVYRPGAVAVTCTLHRAADDQLLGMGLLMEDVVQPAWIVAADLVNRLGGSGRTALRVRTRARITVEHRNVHGELGEARVADWTADAAPSDDDVEYVRRQLLRAAGFEEWEPD